MPRLQSVKECRQHGNTGAARCQVRFGFGFTELLIIQRVVPFGGQLVDRPQHEMRPEAVWGLSSTEKMHGHIWAGDRNSELIGMKRW